MRSHYRRQLSAAEITGAVAPTAPATASEVGLPPPPPAVLSAPPAAVRFAYDGAGRTECAVLHGLAAAYEGLFRLEKGRLVNGRPCYRHIERRDKWIAFSGSAWMAQGAFSLFEGSSFNSFHRSFDSCAGFRCSFLFCVSSVRSPLHVAYLFAVISLHLFNLFKVGIRYYC